MNKTQKLLKTFYMQVDELKLKKINLVGFHGDEAWMCQCASERFIRRAKNPIEMRSLLLIGVLIDQVIYSHFSEIYDDFRMTFKYPKLGSHGGGGCASPNWFVDNKSTGNRVFGDIKVDWSSIRDVYEILFFETRSWFLENNQAESLQKFERLMKVETDSTFIDFPDRVISSINTDELFLRNNL
tara:strand:+ start:99 stop:650 length:552 start_codon:yes stop_codon:yes gene_type:complete